MTFLTFEQKLCLPTDKTLQFYMQIIKNPNYIFCITNKIVLNTFFRLLYESMIYRKKSNLPISKLDLNNIESISIYLNILIQEYEDFCSKNLHQDPINFFTEALQHFYDSNLKAFKLSYDSASLDLNFYLDLINPLIAFNKFIYMKYQNEIDFKANKQLIYIPSYSS